MRIALVADAFPPLRSSGAVQLRDLSLEFARQGHEITVLISSPDLDRPWNIEIWNGVRILRLKTPKTKDIGYVRRTIGEFLMPYAMLRNLRKSPLASEIWDGVVWYSPTIFLAPIIRVLKKASSCRSYLIIRDIFPEWAADMELMGRGLPYLFFKAVARNQYAVADVIGIQTLGNAHYFQRWSQRPSHRVEVLQNWLTNVPVSSCSISVQETQLAGRKVFVYAGNMGVAQGAGIFMDLAHRLSDRSDIGFLFVGRGSDAPKLRDEASARGLKNVAFFDEIGPEEISGLYAQCHVGLVALDPRHKTHNIPGKFLSYMASGLPVLASINQGNDLSKLINHELVGRVCTDGSVDSLQLAARELIADMENGGVFADRCRALVSKLFSSEVAVKQIVSALQA